MADDYTTGRDRGPVRASRPVRSRANPQVSEPSSALLMQCAQDDQLSSSSSAGQLLSRLNGERALGSAGSQSLEAVDNHNDNHDYDDHDDHYDELVMASSRRALPQESYLGQQYSEPNSREQETNQQIVSFLANNHLPDLICETFIELLFICVFLAVTWIFVMIVQLHCHQLQQPARMFYCNTKFLSSLMYCNNKSHLAAC